MKDCLLPGVLFGSLGVLLLGVAQHDRVLAVLGVAGFSVTLACAWTVSVHQGLRTGFFPQRWGRPTPRSEHPIAFWVSVVFASSLAAMAFSYAWWIVRHLMH
ncbi:MAG: hypothetical protein HZA93_05070 [Verrucomicrobia bacterium]|nr:hypothetical protein [Verrucomicrobiota bacterium]